MVMDLEEEALGRSLWRTAFDNSADLSPDTVPTKIQIPRQGNLVGRSLTAQPPVVSPSSILLPLSSHRAFIHARKNAARL
jgi:hypothetical protein